MINTTAVSNGKNCASCNKQRVCKYKDDMENKINEIMNNFKDMELPLTININCREWDSNSTKREI